MALRVLHVDDEPDIRELVALSLGLDPAFTVRSCASSAEALGVVAEWYPHLVIVDVTMPNMDGPTMLSRLRADPKTAKIPVVFMTARAQAKELEHFGALGAAGIISKPFDPMTLAESVRNHMRATGVQALYQGFVQRLQSDTKVLGEYRSSLAGNDKPFEILDNIRTFAHGLAGIAGVFGFREVGDLASDLEEAVTNERKGKGGIAQVEAALDQLLAGAGRACGNAAS